MRSLTARGPFDSYILLESHFEYEDIFLILVVGGGSLFGSLNLTKFIYIVV